MNYANIEEVYGSTFVSKKKKRKTRVPLESSEMETKILSKDDMKEFTKRNTPESRVSMMGANPYDPVNSMYDNTYINNESIAQGQPVGPNSPFNHPYSMYHYVMNDPDYKDFLIYKKMKHHTNDLYEPFQNVSKDNISGDEFDQLLLYIATGLFILIMFDNVYKLGVHL